MPRHAPELECSAEDRASLVALTKSRTVESRAVERARIILAGLEGKEMQQVARELRVSVLTVSKWRRRFSLFGLRGLRDQPRSGSPVVYDTAFRNRVLAALEEAPPLSVDEKPSIQAIERTSGYVETDSGKVM